jgi:hypothetical protein
MTVPDETADTLCVTPWISTMFQVGVAYPVPVAVEAAVPVIELTIVGTELTTESVDAPVNDAVDVWLSTWPILADTLVPTITVPFITEVMLAIGVGGVADATRATTLSTINDASIVNFFILFLTIKVKVIGSRLAHI